MESLFPLSNSNGFMPHGMCFLWQQDILYTQVVADTLTGLAYYGITAALAYIFIKRDDIPYKWLIIPFGILMFFACGTSHFFSVWTIWNPDFGTQAAIKAMTGIASISTAIILWYLMPKVIALPSPALLRRKNEALGHEVLQRKNAEQKIQQINEALEQRVQERTWQLETINKTLRKEITERRHAEKTIVESEQKFRNIVEGSIQGIFVHRNYKPLFANQKCADMFGYDNPGDIMALNSLLETFWMPEERNRSKDYSTRRIAGEAVPNIYQSRGMRKDGTPFWFEKHVTLIGWQGEKATQVALIDINDRKQAENALQNIVESTSPHIGQDFFRVLVKHLANSLGVQYAFVGELFGDNNDAIQTIAVWSGENYAENFQYKLAGTPCKDVTVRKLCSHPQDVQSKFPDDPLLVEMNAESYVGITLLGNDGKILGILAVLDVKPIEDISLIKSIISIFADRAAAELERKYSEKKTHQLLQQNRELAQHMFNIQETERRHIARELHDEFGQQLAAIHLNAETIKILSKHQHLKIHESAQVIDEIAIDVQKNIRGMLRQLRPTLLDEMGLMDSLKELVNQWQIRFPMIDIKFSMEGELNGFEENLNISIYRIIQESLTNVAKHAEALNVSVQLIRQPGEIEAQDRLLLIVKDNGKGLDDMIVAEGAELPGLRERVLAVGGEFVIKSIKGKGVHIEARIPINVTL